MNTTTGTPVSDAEAIFLAFQNTGSPWQVVDALYAGIKSPNIATEVTVDGYTTTVAVYRTFASHRTAWAHIATIVLTESEKARVFCPAPRDGTPMSAQEFRRTCQFEVV